jgi:acetyl esterase/lipase
MAEKFIEREVPFIPAKTGFIKRQWHDLPYATVHDAQLGLDIYLPNEGEGPFPVIVDVYGGGLYFGKKSSHKLEPALRLLEEGFAVVSLDYSLIWQEPFPFQVYEVKAAIRWVRAHAEEYDLDTDRLALMGESSGAHLAVMSAATARLDVMMNPYVGEHNEQSEQVDAVIAMYGPYEFDKFEKQFGQSGVTPKYAETGTTESFEAQMFDGKAPKDVPQRVAMNNPARYFTDQMPPILAFVGKQDPVVPYQQTINMIDAAREVLPAEDVELVVVPDGVHGPADYMTAEYTLRKRNFLQRIFGR